MAADAGSIARLSRLLSEGRLDSSALGQRATEIASLLSRWQHDAGLPRLQIELPGLRPAVVPPELARELEELRKFRRFFRNAYVLDLDPDQTRGHGERVLRVHPQLATGISALLGHVERVVQALALG